MKKRFIQKIKCTLTHNDPFLIINQKKRDTERCVSTIMLACKISTVLPSNYNNSLRDTENCWNSPKKCKKKKFQKGTVSPKLKVFGQARLVEDILSFHLPLWGAYGEPLSFYKM